MLTTDELDQIRGVVREEVSDAEKRLRSVVREELTGVERRLQADLTAVREDVKSVEDTIIQQGKVLLDAIEINGQEQIKTDQRVDRIEKHLNLPPGK